MKFERAVAMIAAVSIVAFVMYLIWRNQPFASPDLARAMRIILSLGIGILGGTIPGFLNVSYNLQGFAIRAGGALALFVITFFGSPSVEAFHLNEPKVTVSDLPQIDIRTKASPDKTDNERLDAEAVATVPISIRNVAEPAKSAYLERVDIDVNFGKSQHSFVWRYFVNMHEEKMGLWLAIESDATPQSIRSGEVVNLEVLSEPKPSVTWREVLSDIGQSGETYLVAVVTYHITMEGHEEEEKISKTCLIDTQQWQGEIKRFSDSTKRAPGRVTMNCVSGKA